MKQLEEVQQMLLEKKLFSLAVAQIQAAAEPGGYNLSYSFSLKKCFCFNVHKKHCSEASPFKAGSSLNFSNSEVPKNFS